MDSNVKKKAKRCCTHSVYMTYDSFFLNLNPFSNFPAAKTLYFLAILYVCVCELSNIYMYVWYNAICMLFELRFKYFNILIFSFKVTLLAEVAPIFTYINK